MAGFDDLLCDINPAARLPSSDPINGGNRKPGPICERFEGAISSPNVFSESHSREHSRKRDSCQPKTGRCAVIPIFGYDLPKGARVPQSITEAICEAVISFAKANGNAAVTKKTGIPKSTVGRWVTEGRFALNTRNLNAVCKIEEVRASAARVLLKRRDAESVDWEAIAADLSEILSPAAGWTLVRKLKEMNAIGMLDPKFSILEGAIQGKLNAVEDPGRSRKLSKLKGK